MGIETISTIAPILSIVNDLLKIIIGYAMPANSFILSNTSLVCSKFKQITDSLHIQQYNHTKASQLRFVEDKPNLVVVEMQQKEIDFLLQNEAAILAFNFPDIKVCFAKFKASLNIISPSHQFVVREYILDRLARSIIKTKIQFTLKNYSNSLNCNHCFLTRFPGKIITENTTYWTKLEQLNLDNNQLQSLPPEIGQLNALESLSVTNNQLQRLPVEMGQLKSLLYFFANENRLQNLPAEVVQLKDICELHLQNNQLESLPLEVVQLAQGAGLYLANNQLKELPENLRENVLRDNQGDATTKVKVIASQSLPKDLHNEVKRLKIGNRN